MIIRKATLITVNEDDDVLHGDLRISDGRIVEIAPHVAHSGSAEEEIDGSGCFVLPGFVQSHVHLCQTLFRGLADDLALMEWLRDRIWPMEAWLDADAMDAAARLGLHELISGGTTSLLDMGSVRHTDVLFAAAEEAGVRYVGGKCLMDLDDGGAAPAELVEDGATAMRETEELIDRWHGAADGRLRYAISPRFAVSCSEELLRRAGEVACLRDVRLHTHASENVDECAIIRERTGRENVDYLVDMGLLGSHVVLAHCVHINEAERDLMWGTGTHVAHCPSSNLKLASGFAPIPELVEHGVNVGLGVDGAPCNNRLSMFEEMRLAALMHKPGRDATALPAATVLRMATMGGAAALGLDEEIGSLEVGKRADVIVLDMNTPSAATCGDPTSTVVYSGHDALVRDVFVDGRALKRDGEVLALDHDDTLRRARTAWERLTAAFPHVSPDSGIVSA